MPRLIWSPAALRDGARLHRFHEHNPTFSDRIVLATPKEETRLSDRNRSENAVVSKSPDAAKRAVVAIRQGVRLLVDHPKIARPVDGMPPEFREWPIGLGAGGYVVLYRVDDREAVILAVRHAREAGH